jgi:hypothetical protein
MHARMWGGLLQDTVSPMGDMVHFVFVFILQKLLKRRIKLVCNKHTFIINFKRTAVNEEANTSESNQFRNPSRIYRYKSEMDE